MRRWAAVGFLLCVGAGSTDGGAATSAIRRVLVIGLDGTTGYSLDHLALRTDRTPHFRSLIEGGQHAPCDGPRDARCARAHSGPRSFSDLAWVTGPGWASVLTGVDSSTHGVGGNEPRQLSAFTASAPAHPSFLKRAHDLGLGTAAGGVGAFLTARDGEDLYHGVLDYECEAIAAARAVDVDAAASCNLDVRKPQANDDEQRDAKLASWLVEQIARDELAIVMGVFDRIDEAGHRSGFVDSDPYRRAIEATDGYVGALLAAVERRVAEHDEEWLVIVTADHGGHSIFGTWGDHGSVTGEDDAIPFIVATFGSSRPLRPLVSPVTHMDVHPTAMRWLGHPSPTAEGVAQAVE